MTMQLDPSTLRDLAPQDRLLFQRFGVGPAATVPYRLLHHAFEAQAAARPHATALIHLGSSMTYGELDRQADRLADLLVEGGVRPGERVGLFLERSIPMVVGMLAVLKAGATYVPQDLRITPASHLDHIIATAGIRVILTLHRFTGRLTGHSGGDRMVIPVDEFLRGRGDFSPRPRVSQVDPTAVVIFTSGTSGKPNGVEVTHANLCNVLHHGPATLGVQPGMRVAQILNIAFDMAVWEVFVALSHGATLLIRGRDIETAVRSVDVVIATPSILARLDAGRCRNVRIAAVAGERCPQSLADTWASFCAFHNSCGPTEVTIVNTLTRHRAGTPVTIGRPLPNNTVYILDENLAPCPIGQVGEMWAGGGCVTAGYLGDPALTGQRYLPDPFLGGAHRMFRTRDLARWTPGGDLEFHGRTDDQVKVNGFRVELDAVTNALEQTPHCRRASTIVHDGRLVGFVTPASIDPEAARETVARALPYYCVPSRVVAVDELPVTSRGKVDRRMLAAALDSQPDSEPMLVDVVA